MTKGETRNFYNNMDSNSYILNMGGSTSGMIDRDSGLNQPQNTVYRYFNILREYAINRYQWTSSILNPYDAQLIEWLFFMTGKACLVYPVFYSRKNRNKGIRIKRPTVYNTNITLQNHRTSEPLKINIIDNYINSVFMPLKKDYNFTEFAMLSSNYTFFAQNNIPLCHTAWEYANKLYELDLTFNANATKQRLPIMINNGVQDIREQGQYYNSGNFTTGDLVKSAVARNEQFIEIPQSQIGTDGVLHNTNQFLQNNLMNYIETQRRLYDEFFEIIGIEVKSEKHGVYEARDVQMVGLATNNYKSTIGLRNRKFHAEQANKRFNLDLKVEMIDYHVTGGNYAI